MRLNSEVELDGVAVEGDENEAGARDAVLKQELGVRVLLLRAQLPGEREVIADQITQHVAADSE